MGRHLESPSLDGLQLHLTTAAEVPDEMWGQLQEFAWANAAYGLAKQYGRRLAAWTKASDLEEFRRSRANEDDHLTQEDPVTHFGQPCTAIATLTDYPGVVAYGYAVPWLEKSPLGEKCWQTFWGPYHGLRLFDLSVQAIDPDLRRHRIGTMLLGLLLKGYPDEMPIRATVRQLLPKGELPADTPGDQFLWHMGLSSGGPLCLPGRSDDYPAVSEWNGTVEQVRATINQDPIATAGIVRATYSPSLQPLI